MSTAPRKLRILALHGFASNAFQFSRRLGALRKACNETTEWHFLNAPILVQPVSVTLGLEARDEPVTEDTPVEEQPRAWWRADDESGEYVGWKGTLEYINEALEREGPFDAVLGFSQGGCLTGILVSAFEDPSRLPGLKLPANQGPLRFAVNVAGFRSRDTSLQGVYLKQGIKTPLLHVLGKNDQIVDEDRAMTLVEAHKSASRVEWHEGGHVVPSQAPWRRFFAAFFEHFHGDAYTPSEAWRDIPGADARPLGQEPDSTPGSGAATPNDKSSTKPSL